MSKQPSGRYQGKALRSAVSILLNDLTQACKEFDVVQRAGAMTALETLGLFVSYLSAQEYERGQPVHLTLEEPIFRLLGALSGLEHGSVDPLLAPAQGPRRRPSDDPATARSGNRPRLSLNVLFGRAHAAAAVESLMQCGVSRQDASAVIAEQLSDCPLLVGVSGKGWRAIARWRDDIRALMETRSIEEMPMGTDNERLAAGLFNHVVCQAKTLRQERNWGTAETADYAVRCLSAGIGVGGGTPNSELATWKSERHQE